MKTLSLLLLLFMPLTLLMAQATPAEPCNYDQLMREGRAFYNKGNLDQALLKFNSARRCDPSKGEQVDREIQRVFTAMNRLKQNAEKNAAELEKQVRRSLANEIMYKIQLEKPSRSVAFRLADYALRLDPDNVKATQVLMDSYYGDNKPWRRVLYGHRDSVLTVAFSPDGAKLATGSSDKTIKLWDVATGRELFTLSGHTGSVYLLAFSADGTSLASGAMDRTVVVWDLAAKKAVFKLDGYDGDITALAFSQDGKKLATGSLDSMKLKVWEWDENKEVVNVNLKLNKALNKRLGKRNVYISDLLYLADGNELAIDAQSLDINDFNYILLFKKDSLYTRDIKKYLSEKNINYALFPAPIFAEIAPFRKSYFNSPGLQYTTLYVKEGRVYFAELHIGRFSSDGEMLAISSPKNHFIDGTDFSLNLISLRTRKTLLKLGGNEASVLSIAFSPDGSKLVSGSIDNTVILWNFNIHKEYKTLVNGHSGPVYSVAFTPDGKKLISSGFDNVIKVWDLDQNTELFSFSSKDDNITILSENLNLTTLSSNGRYIASGDPELIILDLITGLELMKLNEIPVGVAFSPDGNRLAFSVSFRPRDYEKDYCLIKIIPLANPEEMITLKGHQDGLLSMAFSHPSGEKLAFVAPDSTIVIWDIIQDKKLFHLNSPNAEVSSLAFSPDGTQLVAGYQNSSIIVWDLITHNSFILYGHKGRINSAIYSPDGKTIASGSVDMTIRIWDSETKNLLSCIENQSIVTSLAFSSDGRNLASGLGGFPEGQSGIKIWDLITRKEVFFFESNKKLNAPLIEEEIHDFSDLSFNDDTLFMGKVVAIHDSRTGNLLYAIAVDSWIEKIARYPNSTDKLAVQCLYHLHPIWLNPQKIIDEAADRHLVGYLTSSEIEQFGLEESFDFMDVLSRGIKNEQDEQWLLSIARYYRSMAEKYMITDLGQSYLQKAFRLYAVLEKSASYYDRELYRSLKEKTRLVMD